ncbi:hypothetical protein PR048_026200 [Dryococelus australis]|uniref:Uncharacterized protein n=1 Tax=Dryococelus australis TaxID=614101 RepID=A0ABQ9GKQ9_9NEOP|nr:hypothetical protein PR048_026200 [Dryococelus australis]
MNGKQLPMAKSGIPPITAFFGTVLFAAVDTCYSCLFVSIGCRRRLSDDGVFISTAF